VALRSLPFVVSLAAAVSVTPAALAEEIPRYMLLADLGAHVLGLGYGRTLAPELAVQIGADLYSPWTQNVNLLGLGLPGVTTHGDLVGGILRGRAFYYPFASAPSGFWLSPFLQYGLGKATRDGEPRVSSVWAAGASAGYAFLLGRSVVIALGAGAQYHAAHVLGGDGAPSFGRFYPTLDINVGYLF
jgi:hypothetical protein